MANTAPADALLLLLIGLPIVLVLAWYHGDRGQQRISTPEFAILTLLLLLGGGAFWYYQRTTDAGKDAVATASTAQSHAPVIKDARPSVAVLPFENRSREADDAFFVDGIHDDILTQLSKVSALRVISRTSVERFRKSDLSVQEIAQQLGVTQILEGGVQRAGDRVRINVQLTDAASDAHLWAENYDREISAANIFAIQSEIANAVADALKAALTAGEQARVDAIPTKSLEAWQAYQRGRRGMVTRTSAALIEAERHFREAIALDAMFALAWSSLADTLTMQTAYTGRRKDALLGAAEQAATTAMQLDPDLAEAWGSAGLIANYRSQLERSEEMLGRAIALNPNYASAHLWLAATLHGLGRREEALAAAERAVVLDPLSAIINVTLGDVRAGVGRFDDALVAYAQAIEVEPTMAVAYAYIGDVHAFGFGRLDAAMAWYEQATTLDPGAPGILASPARAHWELGDDAEAERWLTRMLDIGEGTLYSYWVAALLCLARGDETSARLHAQQAAELNPANPAVLSLLRDDDLRRGDYATARARFAKAFPRLFAEELPRLRGREAFAAIDLALVLQHTGEAERATALLDRAEVEVRTVPRNGRAGRGIADVAIHALRGDKTLALAKLREAEQAGWRRMWRYRRDFDPNLTSIRNEPDFKAVFADIERDMAKQRAALAARPKDAPLELTDASRRQ